MVGGAALAQGEDVLADQLRVGVGPAKALRVERDHVVDPGVPPGVLRARLQQRGGLAGLHGVQRPRGAREGLCDAHRQLPGLLHARIPGLHHESPSRGGGEQHHDHELEQKHSAGPTLRTLGRPSQRLPGGRPPGSALAPAAGRAPRPVARPAEGALRCARGAGRPRVDQGAWPYGLFTMRVHIRPYGWVQSVVAYPLLPAPGHGVPVLQPPRDVQIEARQQVLQVCSPGSRRWIR
ncbi:hypothetical protein SPURM210S_07292 [Streptomyces purpurascens]